MINEKELQDLITALNSGLVPRSGIENIMVGRDDVIEQIKQDLDNIKSNLSLTKFIVGKFGTGKTFVQALITEKAYDNNFVVSKVDFSPYRRLYHNSGNALSTYTEIIKNMTTKTNKIAAIESIIETWITKQIDKFRDEDNFSLKDEKTVKKIEKSIKKEIKIIDTCFGGADFSNILIKYFHSYVNDDADMTRNCIRWINGEYANITNAKKDLEVSSIITDQNYYEFLKVISKFVVLAGYSGFVINFDEVVNLFKISQKPIRDKNYEMILKIFNDTIQGSISNLFILFSCTPEIVEDEYRGFFSYEALKGRLESNKYENSEFSDYSQPIINLKFLTNEDIVILLNRIIKIHELYYKYNCKLNNDDIILFIKTNYRNLDVRRVPVRNVIRRFIGLLNILEKNKDLDKNELLNKEIKEQKDEKDENIDEFISRFEVI